MIEEACHRHACNENGFPNNEVFTDNEGLTYRNWLAINNHVQRMMALSSIETRDGFKYIDQLDILKELNRFVQEIKSLDK